MTEALPSVFGLSLDAFLASVGSAGIDAALVRRVAQDARRGDVVELERRWYEALDRGEVDWSVYESDAYLAEVWHCWATYSKVNMRSVVRSGLLVGADRIVDLGCGLGLTTAALVEASGSSNVIGTNLPDTKQWAIASLLADRFGFRLSSGVPVGRADVVIVLEFFEHLTSPISYLREVVSALSPRLMIVANSFNTRAIGHFRSYEVDGQTVDASCLGRVFGSEAKRLGYEKSDVGFWNNRPAVWCRRGTTTRAQRELSRRRKR